jgi:hypothetical protein
VRRVADIVAYVAIILATGIGVGLAVPLALFLLAVWPLPTIAIGGTILALASWRDAKAGRRQTRILLGYCAECGYDLRATTDPRCPECGTPFEIYGRHRIYDDGR